MADRQRGAMTGWRGAAALLAVLALPPLPAFAAEPAPAPAYQADLMRFSELVGTIAYLDDLCGGADAGRWRGEMARLLDAQKLDTAARRPYVAAFNRGARSVAPAHQACTPDTRAVLDRFLAEGAARAADIGKRFGAGGPSSPSPTGLPAR